MPEQSERVQRETGADQILQTRRGVRKILQGGYLRVFLHSDCNCSSPWLFVFE